MADGGDEGRVSVLMVGSGEYTTGYVGGGESKSDKGPGVVALVAFDLRRRGIVGDVAIAGVNGKKWAGVREHQRKSILERYPKSEFDISMRCFPEDGKVDSRAYIAAMDSMPKGSAVTIFTPDDTHFEIAMAAVTRGLHVLITKPAVMTLEHHSALVDAAREAGVLISVELHKRFDPIYADAKDRIATYGDFSFFDSYMSQPKFQLDTFKAWAGRSSDISYYLNSHHIDFLEWAVGEFARPVRVTAAAAKGVAKKRIDFDAEDTITLLTDWENVNSGSRGAAVFTSSWIAPTSDVHSQQRFFLMSHEGKFAGQLGYGYRSIESFINAVHEIQRGKATPADFDGRTPTLPMTFMTTAILEAGRRSLDLGGRPIDILYEAGDDAAPPAKRTRREGAESATSMVPTSLRPAQFS